MCWFHVNYAKLLTIYCDSDLFDYSMTDENSTPKLKLSIRKTGKDDFVQLNEPLSNASPLYWKKISVIIRNTFPYFNYIRWLVYFLISIPKGYLSDRLCK